LSLLGHKVLKDVKITSAPRNVIQNAIKHIHYLQMDSSGHWHTVTIKIQLGGSCAEVSCTHSQPHM